MEPEGSLPHSQVPVTCPSIFVFAFKNDVCSKIKFSVYIIIIIIIIIKSLINGFYVPFSQNFVADFSFYVKFSKIYDN